MRRFLGIVGVAALALGGCVDYGNTMDNARSVAYLVDNEAQLGAARTQADADCGQVGRKPRLSNVTVFQRVLTVFDCQPPDNVRFEVRRPPIPGS